MPEKNRSRHKALYALLAIILVVGILLTPVDAFGTAGVSFIDTELKSPDAKNKQLINTKYPIGDAERLMQFPNKLGKWNQTHQYQWDHIAELLDTDVLLARDYVKPGVYVPATLLIVQSTNMSSFHPAPVCFKAQGYTIRDEHTDTVLIPVNDTTWAGQGFMEGADQRAFDGTVEAKRVVVERETNGVVQREINLYFYIKEQSGGVDRKVSWVRLSMFVPATGDFAPHQAILTEFAGEVVPELFAPDQKEAPRSLLDRMTGRGA